MRLVQVHSTSNQLSSKGFVFIKAYTGIKDELYEEITKVALGTPRTLLLSNDPLQFITRSKFLGFPDITAIDIQDGNLIIYATSVFGNRARALKWVSIVKNSLPVDSIIDW